MKQDLVKINPADYGLQANEAATIEKAFIPMLEKMTELETEFNEIVKLPIEPSTIKKAKELRLKYVKIRTGTAEIHKQAKSYFLNGGRFVDGWKNAQLFASQGKEEKLQNIEKHFEILEAERKAKLQAERFPLISELCENPEMYPLGEMSPESFEQLLNGLKLAKEQREAAEKAAEAERLAKIEAERIENERIRAENEKMRLEAIEKEKAIEAERKKQAEILEAQRLEAEKEAKKQAEILAKERAEAEAKQKAIEEAARIEREKAEAERKKLEAEIQAEKARKEAELKAKLEAEKAAKNAPEKEKLLSFEKSLIALPRPEMATPEAKAIMDNVNILIGKVSTYIKENVNKL